MNVSPSWRNQLVTGFAGLTKPNIQLGRSYFRHSLAGARYRYYGCFIEERYKVTHKFTLNIGLRYEIQQPTSDPLGRLSYMDPSISNPGAGNLPGAYVFGGSGNGRQGW